MDGCRIRKQFVCVGWRGGLWTKCHNFQQSKMSAFADEVFQFPEGREIVDEARATELLQTTRDAISPSIIRLSNKSFRYEAAVLVADRLKQFSNIKVADISDVIAGRPEDEALKVLETLCSALSTQELVEVNVSDNALGKKGVIACAGILKGKALRVIYLVLLVYSS
jgi:hypothetical protein